MFALAGQCLRFRELLIAMTRRELDARYRGSALGKLWLFIQPLAFLAIYYVVFASLFQTRGVLRPSTFALAMFAGLIPWIAISETIGRGAGCILEQGNLIKKFKFPSELLPVYLTLVSLVNTVVGFCMLAVGVLAVDGHAPRMIWLLPIALVLQGVLTLGVVYLLSAISVYIRDILQMIPMVLTFVFFMSPIFTFAKNTETPEILQTVFRYNPMTYLIAIYREIFVWTPDILVELRKPIGENAAVALPWTQPGDVPWTEVGILAACAWVALFAGLLVFRRLKSGFADEV